MFTSLFIVIVFLKKLLFDFVVLKLNRRVRHLHYVNVYLLFMYGGYCTRNALSHVTFNRYKRVLKGNILKSWRVKINISLCRCSNV